jgi:biotin carboxyl carrier protein
MEKSFTLTLDGTEYTVEVHGNTFIVNGQPLVVGFEDDGNVTVDGITYTIALDGTGAVVDGITHQLHVSGLDREPTAPSVASPAASAAGAGAVLAIMPGSIMRVLVAEGDQVTEGDILLVLEAMKMENELKAPIDGMVQAIYVEAGQPVEMNAVLVEIQAPETSG